MQDVSISNQLQNAFNRLVEKYATGKQRLVVGYSGGVDSTLLLYLASKYVASASIELLALYLNHGDTFGTPTHHWQEHNQQQCAALGVELKVIQLVLPQGNLENAARDARYQAFSNICDKSDLLLLAHHLDDQHETLLAKLARGASLHGLLIPQSRRLGRTILLRPLLKYPKKRLLACASELELNWIEDPGNTDGSNTRAQIRNKLVPQLENIWQDWSCGWDASEQAIGQATNSLDYFIVRELKGINDNLGLPLTALNHLPYEIQQQLVISWIRLCGCNLPSRQTLNNKLALLLSGKGTNTSIELKNHATDGNNKAKLRLYKQRLWLYTILPELAETMQYQWDGSSPIKLQKSLLFCNQFDSSADKTMMKIAVGRFNGKVQVADRKHHSELRKIMQQHSIPSWERAHTPRIYWQQQLIAIGDIPLCEQAKQLQLCWHPSWRMTACYTD